MNRIHDGQKNMARDMDARIMSEEDGRKRDVDSVRMELDRVSRRLPDGQIATQDQVRSDNRFFTFREILLSKVESKVLVTLSRVHVCKFQDEQLEEVT